MNIVRTTLTAAAAAAILSFSGVGIMAASAADVPAQGNEAYKNQPGYWESRLATQGYQVKCEKIETGFSGTSWKADKDYAFVVLKFATVNKEFPNGAKTGAVLTTDGKHDISHVIACTGHKIECPHTKTPKPTCPGTGGTCTGTPTSTEPSTTTGTETPGTGTPTESTGTPTSTEPSTTTGTETPGTGTPTESTGTPGTSTPTESTGTPTSSIPSLPATDQPSASTTTTPGTPGTSTTTTPVVPGDHGGTSGDDPTPPLAQTGANVALGLLTGIGVISGGAALVLVSRRRG